MIREPQLDASAAWKQRFRASRLLWTQWVRAKPTRGLVVSNRSGVYQLHAWDVPSGELSQLTNRPEGVDFGVISPDGRYVYYFDDTKGNEIGHYVRVPFEGGEAENVTPEIPLYPTFGLRMSAQGNLLAFTTASQDEYQVYSVPISASGALASPRLAYRSKAIIFPPCLSYDGRIAVVTISRGSKLLFGLLAFDTGSGEQLADLCEATECRVEAIRFAPLAGDFRVACRTNRTGLQRPFIWNPSTGDRIDLRVDDLEGEITPVDWSAGGSTTFGREFLEKIWGDLGYWEVEDMVAARAWLVSQGVAKPDQVLLTGWSYGGYLTLQALGTYPDLWAGGMAGIAVADWAIAHLDTTDTLRSLRALRFGGTPEEIPERYAASSPITYAEKVKSPILIMQGRNDTRTPPRSVERIIRYSHPCKLPTNWINRDELKIPWRDTRNGTTLRPRVIAEVTLEVGFTRAERRSRECPNKGGTKYIILLPPQH